MILYIVMGENNPSNYFSLLLLIFLSFQIQIALSSSELYVRFGVCPQIHFQVLLSEAEKLREKGRQNKKYNYNRTGISRRIGQIKKQYLNPYQRES